MIYQDDDKELPSETSQIITAQADSSASEVLTMSILNTSDMSSQEIGCELGSEHEGHDPTCTSHDGDNQLHPMDIGLLGAQGTSCITREEKYKYLTSVWKPNKQYTFPKKLELVSSGHSIIIGLFSIHAYLTHQHCMEHFVCLVFCLPMMFPLGKMVSN